MLHILLLALLTWLVIWILGRVFFFVLKLVALAALCFFLFGLCCGLAGCTSDYEEGAAWSFQAWRKSCQSETIRTEIVRDPQNPQRIGFLAECLQEPAK